MSLSAQVADPGRVFLGSRLVGDIADQLLVLEVPEAGDLLVRREHWMNPPKPGSQLRVTWADEQQSRFAAPNEELPRPQQFLGYGAAQLYTSDGDPLDNKPDRYTQIIPAPNYVNNAVGQLYPEGGMPTLVYEQRYNPYDRRFRMYGSVFLGHIIKDEYPLAPPWHSLGQHDIRQAMKLFRQGPLMWSLIRQAGQRTAEKVTRRNHPDQSQSALESQLQQSRHTARVVDIIDTVIDTNGIVDGAMPTPIKQLLSAAGIARNQRSAVYSNLQSGYNLDLAKRIS